MAASIEIKNLTKSYPGSKTSALDSLSLRIEPGEIYGFLGANGAGKSTTIRLLMHFLRPTSGSATILGYNVVSQSVAVKRHIGYLAGDVALYQKATGRELLRYLMHLQQARPSNYPAELVQRFEAELDKPLATLSKGNRQKIGIIQAFMHQPNVLILDEPTSGLDPLMQEAFYETVREAKQHGAAIFMSSHNLNEAERLCDRIGIIKHGKLIREQSIDKTTTLGATVFAVTFAEHAVLERIKASQALRIVSQPDSNSLRLKATGTLAAALAELSRYELITFRTENIDLEDEFLEYYGDTA
jgi:ABC-2 type transport system ATP-binding protein